MIYNQLQIIGISDNTDFTSNYIPLISFKTAKQKEAVESYIVQEASRFFEKILEPGITAIPIAYPKLITEIDFKEVDISYFYDNLFFDLGERDYTRKLKRVVKWGTTFDEKCAPIKIESAYPSFSNTGDYLSSNNGDSTNYRNRRFGTIDINGTPIFYYLYFTLQEILDVIKKSPFSEKYP